MGLTTEIFSDNKWLLLKEIATKPQSPTELAGTLKTSVSNVIQQLKLLEAYGVVEKIGINDIKIESKLYESRLNESKILKAVGKPKTIYRIKNETMNFIMLKNGFADKRTFKIDANNIFFFNLMFIQNPEDIFFIIKFSISNEEILKKCKTIAFIRSSKDSVELFLITDHTEEIRSRFSNLFIQDAHGKTKKIVNWTHNEFEIIDGINKRDKYYVDMVKNSQILLDNQNILQKFKDTLK